MSDEQDKRKQQQQCYRKCLAGQSRRRRLEFDVESSTTKGSDVMRPQSDAGEAVVGQLYDGSVEKTREIKQNAGDEDDESDDATGTDL